MSKRIIETILGAQAGEIVSVSPTRVLITNGQSHGVTQFATKVAAPEKVLVMFDHNVPSGSPEDAKIFGEILKFANDNKAQFKQAKGTALQYMYDELVKAGDIIITGTKHSAIFGAKGALGVHISSTELARVLEHDKYNVAVPQTVGVSVKGELANGASIMDAAMQFVQQNKNLAGKVIEFAGGKLTQHEKEVLCGMACETGAYTAFTVDEAETEITLDLSAVVPMVTMPCTDLASQEKAIRAPLSALASTSFNAGQIGGFNGGTIEELRKAAKLIEGKKLAYGFRLTVCPATSADYIAAMEEGIITKFIDFNAQISAAGDHSIVPQGAGAMGHGEKLITTGLYTFAGCMGCEDAEVYSASVESVISMATGEGK